MLNRCKNCIIHDFLKWGMSFHSQSLNRCERCKISSDFLRGRTNYSRYAHTACEFWPLVTGVISLCSVLCLFWGVLTGEQRLSILSFVFLLNGRKAGGREQANELQATQGQRKLKRRLQTPGFPLVSVSWQESQFNPTGFVAPLGLQSCTDLPGRLWNSGNLTEARTIPLHFFFSQRVSIPCFLLNLRTQSNSFLKLFF